MKSFVLPVLIALFSLPLFFSCNTAQKLRYFQDLPDTNRIDLPVLEQEPRIIQKGDRLQITFGARNEAASAIFNNYGGIPTSGSTSMGAGSSETSELTGYIVDEEGRIAFPYIGFIKVEGSTVKNVRDTLNQLVAPYLKDPLVNVRFINFKFTVLGEVRNPGTYVLPQQRTTILDALGVAGDLPSTAKRNDIQLYRDYNGKRSILKVDLSKSDLLNNPELFQIKHNDIIYVQPRDIRVLNEETRSYIGLISLLLTSAALIISIIK